MTKTVFEVWNRNDEKLQHEREIHNVLERLEKFDLWLGATSQHLFREYKFVDTRLYVTT